MEQPLVSVICACYNQSKFVVESLESVKNQTYKNLEIIIWDDASADNSVEKIEEWIRNNPEMNIQFIKNKENRGICKSLNTAQNLTTGKYIQLLALDDFLLPDKITRHVEILENSSDNIALVFTDAFLMNDNSELYQNRFIALYKNYLSLKTENYFDDLIGGNFIPAMSILYKSSYLKNTGPWDENLAFEDYDMLLRLAKKYDFIFDEKVSVTYRLHENNTHKKLSAVMENSLFKVYLKHINAGERVNVFLKSHIIKMYKNGNLSGEQIEYFNQNPPKNFKDRCLRDNNKLVFYKLAEKLRMVKTIIFAN